MTYVTTQTAHTMATVLTQLNSNYGAAKPWLVSPQASKIDATVVLPEKQRELLFAARVVTVKMLRRAWQWM